MANHYVFEPEFCNPAADWEKGQVEKNVQDARPRLWQPMTRRADKGHDAAEVIADLGQACVIPTSPREPAIPGRDVPREVPRYQDP